MILLPLPAVTQPGPMAPPASGRAPQGGAFARMLGAVSPGADPDLPPDETTGAKTTGAETTGAEAKGADASAAEDQGGDDPSATPADPAGPTGPPGEDPAHPLTHAPPTGPARADPAAVPSRAGAGMDGSPLTAGTATQRRDRAGGPAPSQAPAPLQKGGRDPGPALHLVPAGPRSESPAATAAPAGPVPPPARGAAPARPALPAAPLAGEGTLSPATRVPLRGPDGSDDDPLAPQRRAVAGAEGAAGLASPAPPAAGDAPLRPAPAAGIDRPALRQIAVAVAAQPDGTTELRLSPEELGRVRLSLSTSDGLVTLSIQAERPETADLIRRNLDLLARDFREMGFGGFEFSFGSGTSSGGQTAPGQPGGAHGTDPADEPPETILLRGLDLRL